MGKLIQFPYKRRADPLQNLSEDLHAYLRILGCGVVALPVVILSNPYRLRMLIKALSNYLGRLEARQPE